MERFSQRQLVIIVGAIAAVVAVAVIAMQIIASAPSASSANSRYEGITHTRLEDGGFLLGNPDAPITLVEFGDFACPHCQEYSVEVKRFIDEYVKTGKAKFEYRLFISGADPTYGPYTAQLAECAANLRDGAFWPAHDILFDLGRSQGRFNDRTARTLADQLELSYSDLLNCTEDAEQVDFDVRYGQSLNVQSTPTMMIRYGDSEPQFISDGVRTYDRGGVPLIVLQAAVETAQ